LLASACVLPLGPQFEDPPGNTSPFLARSNPTEGEVLTGTSPVIEVVVGDDNLSDKLIGRWFIDYPPFDEAVTRMVHEFRLPSTGKAERGKVRFAPNCGEDQIATGMASHRISLSVADRPFLPEEQSPPSLRLDSVPEEGFVLRATWILNLTCEP
jgi:hypothetical protein